MCALNLIENNCARDGKVDEHTNDSARMVSVRLLLTQLNIQRQHSNYKWILARHYTNETMQLQQTFKWISKTRGCIKNGLAHEHTRVAMMTAILR